MTPPQRPGQVVVVLGTGTEVGKTWVTVALAERLRDRGLLVSVRKPAQSFVPGETTDAETLAQASGEAAEAVCLPHRWYPVPLAPPIAAEALGRPVPTIADLVGELDWPAGRDVGLVEGAGGVRSPLAIDGDAVDLVAAIGPDLVVLVAGAGLGTLNLVRLCTDALAGYPLFVYLNRFDREDDLHRRNLAWLEVRLGQPVAIDLDGLAGTVAGHIVR